MRKILFLRFLLYLKWFYEIRLLQTRTHAELCQASEMGLLAKIFIELKFLTFLEKDFHVRYLIGSFNLTSDFASFSTSDQRYFNFNPQCWNNVDPMLKYWPGHLWVKLGGSLTITYWRTLRLLASPLSEIPALSPTMIFAKKHLFPTLI